MNEQSQSEQDASDWDDFVIHVRLGIWIAPVVIVFGWLFLSLLRAMSGWTTPIAGSAWAVAWLWINGGLLAALRWSRRKGRWPVGRQRWLDGEDARRAAARACLVSLAAFAGFVVYAWLRANAGG